MEEQTKCIEINGCCEVPDNVSVDEFNDLFIDFVESHGWYFGGGIHEYKDDEEDK